MTEWKPLVSIVIPVYNGSNYLREAIDSALAQTYKNIEILVINDGSNDNGATERIALSYGDKIRYFHKENGGVATALNYGISKMQGEYFSWLSHDDMYMPGKVDKELQYLAAQPESTTIIAEGYQVVDLSGNYICTVNLHQQYDKRNLVSPLFALFRGGINGCALLIHKSHFLRVGLFNPDLPTTQDYDLWFRMFRGQKIFYAPTANVLSRSHPEQGSKAGIDAHIMECDSLWIGMMSVLTDEERTEISGSPWKFYMDLRQFLRTNTLYAGAIAHASRQAYKEAVKEYRQTADAKPLEWICTEAGFSNRAALKNVLPYCSREKALPRLAFFLEERNLGGGLNRVVIQVAGLLAKRYDVALVCSVADEKDGYPVPEDVTEIRIPWGNWDPAVADRLVRLCFLMDVDVLVGSYNCVPHFLDIYPKAREFSISTIAWNHEFYLLPYWRESLRPSVVGRNKKLSKADAVVWLNAFSNAAYGLFHSNGLCLPNPCTVTLPEPEERKQTKKLIAAGRFEDARKGLESLLRMFAVVAARSPVTELTILGSYELQQTLPSDASCTYEKLIRQLKLPTERLHFEGWASDVERYYRNADVHVLPSIHEGFGLVILEAAAYGIPSVVYGGSGMEDIITNGVDGMIAAEGDWKDLAEKTLALLEDPARYAEMSAAARKLPQRYAPDKISALWGDVVDAVLYKSAEERNAYFAANYHPSIDDQEQFHRRIMQVYEECISQLNTQPYIPSEGPPTAVSPSRQVITVPGGEWYEECMRLQQTFSWRITKPLRLIKRAALACKREGFFSVVRKVCKI